MQNHQYGLFRKIHLNQQSQPAESVSVCLTLRTVENKHREAKIKTAETSGSHMVTRESGIKSTRRLRAVFLWSGASCCLPAGPVIYRQFWDERVNTFERLTGPQEEDRHLKQLAVLWSFNIPNSHRPNKHNKHKHKRIV